MVPESLLAHPVLFLSQLVCGCGSRFPLSCLLCYLKKLEGRSNSRRAPSSRAPAPPVRSPGERWSLHCCSLCAVSRPPPPPRPVSVSVYRCVSCVVTGGRGLACTKPFLYPADQLRGPPALPEQSVSVEELQGQLVQAARLHQEETETYTNKIRKVNIS